MRKNDVRKWIHAGLDLLPLLVIPIFAIAVRSDNNFQPIEVTYSEDKVVYFNQLVNDENIYTFNQNGIQVTAEDTLFHVVGSQTGRVDASVLRNSPVIAGHQYYFRSNLTGQTQELYTGYCLYSWSSLEATRYVDTIWTANSTSTITTYFLCNTDSNRVFNDYFFINEFDLTAMGLEGITKEDFDNLFPLTNYSYTYNQQILLEDYSVITYNDTDVGSQMVYTLYNTCYKYFNFNNVFNFNQIYDWLTINIFNGQVPMSAFIAWNVFLYEFLMDLIFLMYALFMFFIDMCTNLIDRFTCQASGRRLK